MYGLTPSTGKGQTTFFAHFVVFVDGGGILDMTVAGGFVGHFHWS